jgi:hypothetical protein
MSQPLLPGPPAPAEDPVRLRREIAGLEQELQKAKEEARQAKQAAADSVTAIRALRKIIEPIYKATAMIMGEISRVAAEQGTDDSPENSSSSLSPKWHMMREKLGHREAQVIDALQHGGMTAKQLTPVLHWDIKTVYRVTQKMKNAGLLNNDVGKFSLREL